MGYIFKTVKTPIIKEGTIEDNTVKRMITLWTNFAKYANPNPIEKDTLINVNWKPVCRNQINYLNIGANLEVGINPESERMTFWDNIFKLNPAINRL